MENLILSKRQDIIKKIPIIENYFVNIFIERLGFEVPFLPIRCFRDIDLNINFSEEKKEDFKFFFSSGSTGNKPSRHIFSRSGLKNYEQQTCLGFQKFLFRHHVKTTTPLISFIPQSHEAPGNSLAAMVSMFSQNGFSVYWHSPENSITNLISYFKLLPEGETCLIFGTTFHHLVFMSKIDRISKKILQQEMQRLQIGIIDTGGTKGRTQAMSLEQSQKLFQNFYKTKNLSLFSEYGMCELGSQAWSKEKIHDGSFVCNPSLHPFVISLKEKATLELKKQGFLAFIDEVNVESWPAIITEDLAFQFDEISFFLNGRAPDATIKGCSLNVKNFFSFSNEPSKTIKIFSSHQEKKIINLDDICLSLKKKNWDSISIEDFKTTMPSIQNSIQTDTSLKDKNILIISSANTPIPWVFPYMIACTNKAKSITLKIPSLRLDDYLSQSIINKTQALVEIFSQYFPNTRTIIDNGRSISKQFDLFDIILVFGTEETISTILNQIDPKKTKFIGKGDIKNSMTVDAEKDDPAHIAKLCALWDGRGCLTPVAIFCNGSNNKKEFWAKEFSKNLEIEFKKRYDNKEFPEIIKKFSHDHNVIYTESQIRVIQQLSEQVKNCAVIRSPYTAVVNLLNMKPEDLKFFEVELNFGGCGFVYLFSPEVKSFLKNIKELDIIPSLESFIF